MDAHYNNFLSLIKIINLIFCFVFYQKTITDFEEEITKYLRNFAKLNLINFTPKLHFLVHLPNQMKNFHDKKVKVN